MFVAHLSGEGGCDYTMGCNIKVRELQADTWDDAIAETERLIRDYSDYVDEVEVFEVVSKKTLNPTQIKQKVKEEKEKRKLEEKQAQYEELKKQFEG